MNPQDNPTLIKELAEKRAKAFELKAKGYSYKAIADELGYANESGAYKAVQEARRTAISEPINEVVQTELATLGMLQRKAIAALEAAKDGNLTGINETLSILKRRSDLLGLDAPKHTSFSFEPQEHEPDQLATRKARLIALVAQSKEARLLSTGSQDGVESSVPDGEISDE